MPALPGSTLRCSFRRTGRGAALAAATVAFLFVAAASAVQISVTTLGDEDLDDGLCSLREAILAANGDVAYHGCPAGGPADRIELTGFPSKSVIELGAALPAIAAVVEIAGPGANDLAIDGMEAWPILEIDGGAGSATVVVEGLTLTRGFGPGPFGWAGAATVRPGDSAIFRRVRFVSNRALNGGGALQLVSGPDDGTASATLRSCLFEGNEALGPVGGGAIYASDGSELTVESSTFFDNSASAESGHGGAIAIQDSALEIYRSTLSGNRASGSGGALFALSTTTATMGLSIRIADTTITQNSAEENEDGAGDGGGIHLRRAGTAAVVVELANSLVGGNIDGGPEISPDVFVNVATGVSLLSGGFNLIGSNAGSEALFPAGTPNGVGDFVGSVGAPLPSMLAPLADNGGGLPTHLPIADSTSWVVDQGKCSFAPSDQRGFVDGLSGQRAVDRPEVANRPGGDYCDIGAVETGAVEPESLVFADGFEGGDLEAWSSSQVP
uniref:Polymorphic outer membrane protein n=1 Tax=uncultured bacterium A1Q1_fos_2037 TaxID=1256558 RepID=L7VXR0_9BACT|nr:polymorphic outer membrane protein [uncultured bacterium A1Q1_fos_2037]